MMRRQPELPQDPNRELERSVVVLGSIYAVFLLAVILINIGWR